MTNMKPAGAGQPALDARALLFGAALFLVALNLRPALSSLATILEQVQQSLALSPAATGVLTMAPSLSFGLSGGLALMLARSKGLERGVALALACLIAGLLTRMLPSVGAIFLGTVLAGIGIGVAGVLLPAIIKRDFAGRLGLMTGLYTMAMCGGGALAAALTVPFEQALNTNWNVTLGLWAIPAGLTAVAWLPYAARQSRPVAQRQSPGHGNLWRDRLAWSVTGFMTLQAALAFIVLGWLPTILQSRGLDALGAGYVTSASVLTQTVTALCAPMIATRLSGQRLLVVMALLSSAIGFSGITLGSVSHVVAWGIVLGLGQGANFGLALVFIGLRTSDSGAAARLSSMSQSVGYTLAACGPLAAGIIRQWSSEPIWQTVLFVAIAFLALLCGLLAGAQRVIGQTGRETPTLPAGAPSLPATASSPL